MDVRRQWMCERCCLLGLQGRAAGGLRTCCSAPVPKHHFCPSPGKLLGAGVVHGACDCCQTCAAPACCPPPGQVLEVEDVVQDEASRRRMRVLSHLPLTATFKLCEVDLSCEWASVSSQAQAGDDAIYAAELRLGCMPLGQGRKRRVWVGEHAIPARLWQSALPALLPLVVQRCCQWKRWRPLPTSWRSARSDASSVQSRRHAASGRSAPPLLLPRRPPPTPACRQRNSAPCRCPRPACCLQPWGGRPKKMRRWLQQRQVRERVLPTSRHPRRPSQGSALHASRGMALPPLGLPCPARQTMSHPALSVLPRRRRQHLGVSGVLPSRRRARLLRAPGAPQAAVLPATLARRRSSWLACRSAARAARARARSCCLARRSAGTRQWHGASAAS